MVSAVGVFAKLNASTMSMEPFAGGRVEFSQADAAAILSSLPPRLEHAARLKFCLDESRRKWLETELWIEMSGEFTRRKWKVPAGKELLRRICTLVIDEALNAAVYRFEVVKYSQLELTHSQWTKTWRDRYHTVGAEFDNWCNLAEQRVRRKLQQQWACDEF